MIRRLVLLATTMLILPSATNAADDLAFPSEPSKRGEVSPEQQMLNYMEANKDAQNPFNEVNGISPLPPLAPPSDEQINAMANPIPISPEQIVTLKENVEKTKEAVARPVFKIKPRKRAISVDTSLTGDIPEIFVSDGMTTTLIFLDATGKPWPLAASPRISKPKSYKPEWINDSHTIILSPLTSYDEANISVLLKGSPTPVIITLKSAEADKKSKTKVVDVRLDFRVPGRGPNAEEPIMGEPKIALYDDVMQSFLDGIIPQGAKPVEASDTSTNTKVWWFNNKLYVRTRLNIRTAFEKSMASADGTTVYEVLPTPFITVSENGNPITLALNL